MDAPQNPSSPYLHPGHILRVEALLFLVAELLVYRNLLHGSWPLFALLFLAPDISLFAFLLPSKALASNLYNLLHNEAIPLAVLLFAWKLGQPHLEQIAVIWLVHIAFDRLLGYGLKYPRSFGVTHLQRAASQD